MATAESGFLLQQRIKLSSAAVWAAIELDNIFLKRKFKTSDIQLLAKLISLGIPLVEEPGDPALLITPTVIVMQCVVRVKNSSGGITSVVDRLKSLVRELDQLAGDPVNSPPELVERLRIDCLDLGRFARAIHRK